VSKKAIEQIEREISERKAAEKAKHDAEIQRLADADSKRRAAEEAERKRQIEAADKRRAERFEAELEEDARALFYSGNPGAAPSLWQTVRDEYRRLVMRRRAEVAAGQSHSLYKW
jgi:membrane protein involved in colicin uptake